MNSLEFKLLWTDDRDGMVQLAVKAVSADHAACNEIYLYPDELEEFAVRLKDFPQAADAEVVLECGSKDPEYYGYFWLRVFLLKPTGHSAVEIESEVHLDPPHRVEVRFFIPGMPADFNRMGADLMEWLANMSNPLRIEWTNN